jgi:hypothetical protein
MVIENQKWFFMKKIHILAGKAYCEKRILRRSEMLIEKIYTLPPVSSTMNARWKYAIRLESL